MAKKTKTNSDAISCKEISCRELNLVDESGAMVATFTTKLPGVSASMRMYDRGGVERCIFEVSDEDVIRLCFMANDTKIGLSIALIDGEPGIRFYDDDMKCAGEIGLDDNFELGILKKHKGR